MATMTARLWVLGGIAAMLMGGCGPTHNIKAPDGFSRFEKGDPLKLITADGVRIKSREVDNYPKATLAFWTDATARHLKRRGYAGKSKRCFKTTTGLDGCTVDFIIPRGQEDWVFAVTLFVVGDKIVLVEAAGPYKRYAPVEKRIQAALVTFTP